MGLGMISLCSCLTYGHEKQASSGLRELRRCRPATPLYRKEPVKAAWPSDWDTSWMTPSWGVLGKGQGAENEKAFFWGSVFNETIHWFISLLLESHLLHMTESTSGKKLPGPTVTNMSSSVPSLSLTCCNKAVNNSNLQVWFHKSEASFVLRAVDVSLPFFVSGLDKGGLVRAWFWFWSLFTALGCSTLWRLRVKAVNVALRISC